MSPSNWLIILPEGWKTRYERLDGIRTSWSIFFVRDLLWIYGKMRYGRLKSIQTSWSIFFFRDLLWINGKTRYERLKSIRTSWSIFFVSGLLWIYGKGFYLLWNWCRRELRWWRFSAWKRCPKGDANTLMRLSKFHYRIIPITYISEAESDDETLL